MTLNDLLAALHSTENELVFTDVLATIDAEFDFTPSAFVNGNLQNSAEENQGSCKVISFAHQAGLNEELTLKLFAEHYQDVLADSEGTGHQNIRQFMQHGWAKVSFAQSPLKKK